LNDLAEGSGMLRTHDPELRWRLRDATRAAHAALDASMATLDLTRRADYAAFLSIQAAALAGIEIWLAGAAPDGWAPPRQTPLIAADLAALAQTAPPPAMPAFAAPASGWEGVAYVVAGSHLGNRAILAGMGEHAPAHATAFLGDSAMAAYWRSLLGRLRDLPASLADTAIAGATAAFTHFAACAASVLDRREVAAQ
jgi:heme oxygenase